MTATRAHDIADDPWIDVIVEDCAAIRLEIETWAWRFCGLIVETLVIVLALLVAHTIGGTPILETIEKVAMVAFLFLLGRGVLLTVADLINNGLARLIRWWRRR